MTNTTVIYITDNNLNQDIFEMCQRNILWATKGLRLISVSQKPIDFGENICVGPLERSSLSINKQMLEGLLRVKTDFIAIAEHDCLYTPEHFAFTPPDKEVFYYNENVWVLITYNEIKPEAVGSFSRFKNRKANSQLICGKEVMVQSTKDRIEMMADPEWHKRYPTGRIGEAGGMMLRHILKLACGQSLEHIKEKLIGYAGKYKGENFETQIPNVDIRHDKNMTKNRRGDNRRFSLPYWGTMDDIWKSGGIYEQ